MSTRLTSMLQMLLAIAFTLTMTGCATKVVETPSKVTPTSTKLGQYTKLVLIKTEIAPAYMKHPANIKATNKIDEVLLKQLSAIYQNIEVKTVAEAKDLKSNGEKVLVIKPYIKQIKFIGGAARFWAGAMAGSSVVIMDCSFIDLATGKQLANPGYMRKAGAYSDPFGIGSNDMLNQIANDFGNYTSMNQ